MKFSHFSLPVFRDAFVRAYSRFPLALLSAFLFGILAIYLNENNIHSEAWQRILFCVGLGLPLFIGTHILSEQHERASLQKILLPITAFAFLVLVYFFIAPDFDEERMQRPIRYISFLIIGHLMISLSATGRTGNINAFWEFNKEILGIWFVGAFYMGIVFLGLFFALTAVDQLFDLDLNHRLYLDLFIVVASGMHPLYVLSHIPGANSEESPFIDLRKAIKTLCIFILIPISILYILILYAYSSKILIQWELPRGWVSSLVLGFSGVGILTYLLNYRIPDLSTEKIAVYFKKYFFYLLTPLNVLLFVAISRRITDYGFTPNRYFVFITGVWLFLTCLYFIFSKSQNIKLIPLSLILFLLIGTMSPVDAFQTSSRSQFSRLVNQLEKSFAIQNGKITKDLSSLDTPVKENIRETIKVLTELGDLHKVNALLESPLLLDTIAYYDPMDLVLEKTGLRETRELRDNAKTISISDWGGGKEYPISGYDKFISFSLTPGTTEGNLSLLEISGSPMLIQTNPVDTIGLDTILLQIDTQHDPISGNEILRKPFDVSSDRHRKQLYIHQLDYRKWENKMSIVNIQGVLLRSE